MMCQGVCSAVLHTAPTDTAAGTSMRQTAVVKLHSRVDSAGVEVRLLHMAVQ
jgi:hypothetical protein